MTWAGEGVQAPGALEPREPLSALRQLQHAQPKAAPPRCMPRVPPSPHAAGKRGERQPLAGGCAPGSPARPVPEPRSPPRARSTPSPGPRPVPPRPHLAWTDVPPGGGARTCPAGAPTGPTPSAVAPSRAPAAAVRASEGRGALGAEAPAGPGPGAPRAAQEEESVAGKRPECGLRNAPAGPPPPRQRRRGLCRVGERGLSPGSALWAEAWRGGGGTPRGYAMGQPAGSAASSPRHRPRLRGVRRDPYQPRAPLTQASRGGRAFAKELSPAGSTSNVWRRNSRTPLE